MTHERRQRTPNNYLWTRVLGRYRSRRGLLSPRVPLVLRRRLAAACVTVIQRTGRAGVSHYHFALNIHLSSLSWPPGAARRGAPQEPETRRAALLNLVKHMEQAAVHAGRTSVSRRRRQTERASRSTRTTTSPDATSPALSGSTPWPPAMAARTLPSSALSSSARSSGARSSGALSPSARSSGARSWGALSSGALSSGAVPSGAVPSAATRTPSNGRPAQESAVRGSRLATAPPSFSHARSRTERRVGMSGSNAGLLTPLTLSAAMPTLSRGASRSEASRAMTGAAGVTNREWAAVSRTPPADRVRELVARAVSTASAGIASPRAISAPFRPVVTTAIRSTGEVRRGDTSRPAEGIRQPLYAQPVARNLSSATAPAAPQMAPEIRPAAPSQVQAVQPPVDLQRLSEDVYQHIQRRIRIERERRGL
jgi:hypothetical protein